MVDIVILVLKMVWVLVFLVDLVNVFVYRLIYFDVNDRLYLNKINIDCVFFYKF